MAKPHQNPRAPQQGERDPDPPAAQDGPRDAPDGPGAEPPEAPSTRPVWRRVAIARRSCSAYLDGDLVKLLGGEIVAEPGRVESLARDPEAFEIVEVASPEDLALLREERDQAVAELRDRARALGCVVYRDGEVPPPRR